MPRYVSSEEAVELLAEAERVTLNSRCASKVSNFLMEITVIELRSAALSVLCIFVPQVAGSQEINLLARENGWAVNEISLSNGKMCSFAWEDKQNGDKIAIGYDGDRFHFILIGIGPIKPNNRIYVKVNARWFGGNMNFTTDHNPNVYQWTTGRHNGQGFFDLLVRGRVEKIEFDATEYKIVANLNGTERAAAKMLDCDLSP